MVAPADNGHKLMKMVFVQKIKIPEIFENLALGNKAHRNIPPNRNYSCLLFKTKNSKPVNYGRFRCLLANTFSPNKYGVERSDQ
jgi:hypothetical protein